MDVTPQRNAMPAKGPRFFREDGEVMFEFVIDAGNIIGPRLANKADSGNHPLAWSEFAAADAPISPDPAPAALRVPIDCDEPGQPVIPETIVPEKDMGGFAERIEPAPERAKRAYTKRKAA